MTDVRSRWLVIALLMAVVPAGARAQSAANVLVVFNSSNSDSVEVARYYAAKRGVPRDQLLAITTDARDEISRDQYQLQIEAPIALWLLHNSGHDRILYIVLTKGVPIRIAGTNGPDGTVASVDSELALLYRKMLGQPIPFNGRIPNPYYLGDLPVARAKPFTHRDEDIFLVTRLDGFTLADVRALIDRGLAPSRDGRIVLDEKDAVLPDRGNALLQNASDVLAATGFKDRVVLDKTARVVTGTRGVLGYYSWGSNDPAIKIRDFEFAFVPGALAAMFVSGDGRTFAEPPAGWKIGSWDDPKTFFAGAPQSLAGDLIHAGVTGVAGHVAEPYLDATVRPDILFPAYLSGMNLAESFYLAIPYLSWQTVVVGDPLCAPFRSHPLAAAESDGGTDAATELPAYFSARRVQVFSRTTNSDAAKLALRAETRLAKQDIAGGREALEQATAIDSTLDNAHLALAVMYDRSGAYDKAIDRYRRIIQHAPDNVLALSNLALELAMRKNAAAEGLQFAEKAFALSKVPATEDTLGWVNYLAGNERQARRLLEDAISRAPENAAIRVHAAIVYAATHQVDIARQQLNRALELDPTTAQRDDVKRLRSTLGETR